MDAYLILRNICVENANALSGMTWGFPAISQFLGFTHALSRRLSTAREITLDGCGIIAHKTHTHAYQAAGRRAYLFSLSRNPLTREGKTAPFNEEARMSLQVSLVIPITGDIGPHQHREQLVRDISDLVLRHRLAGGLITSVGQVEIIEPPEDVEDLKAFERKLLRRLLPGFAIVQRTNLLNTYHAERLTRENSHRDELSSWLEFVALRIRAKSEEPDPSLTTDATWAPAPKKVPGWIVPLAVGYRAISPLLRPEDVVGARDATTPLRFVEAAYSLGEWVSPHRIAHVSQIVWRYEADPEAGWYLYKNEYEAKQKPAVAAPTRKLSVQGVVA